MIMRYGKLEDAERIKNFLNIIFEEESLVTYCSNFKKNLKEGIYKSIIFEDNQEIIAHAGIFFIDNIAIFNTIAVHPNYRSRGIAKKLLKEKINYCSNKKDITHVIGYCVLNHPWSEKIHGIDFRPIGIMFTDKNPLKDYDPLHKQNCFDGNLVLCKSLRNIKKRIVINYKGLLEERIRDILSKINLEPIFEISSQQNCFDYHSDFIEFNLNDPTHGDYLKHAENKDYVFLGLLPNINTGFLTFGFISRSKINLDNLEIKVSNKEREDFIKKILSDVGRIQK